VTAASDPSVEPLAIAASRCCCAGPSFPLKMTDAIDEHGSRQVIEDAPMKRMGAPEDMAGIALYLASRASGFVCGAVIPVDGGLATTA
jgi:NAD(P)-dependent dehydrogenase (short-subunit alcohol dehydrogenase family)